MITLQQHKGVDTPGLAVVYLPIPEYELRNLKVGEVVQLKLTGRLKSIGVPGFSDSADIEVSIHAGTVEATNTFELLAQE